MEVTHASPKIAAMEFFDVNIRLLPTVYSVSKILIYLFLDIKTFLFIFSVDRKYSSVRGHPSPSCGTLEIVKKATRPNFNYY